MSEPLRHLVAETTVVASNLVFPLFVVPGKGVRRPLPSLPGQFHLSVDELVKEVRETFMKGIHAFLLFGVPDTKDERGESACRDDALIPQALRAVKDEVPQACVITDVCLCAYTTHGHCGVVDEKGNILNDPTLEILSSMALAHARAGVDVIAPSDMMDGRVAALRKALDHNGYQQTLIMSYAAKFASAFYGPFRDVAHSTPQFGDRKTYQMDMRNGREALREMELDLQEGADIVMVKPAMPYLDVISKARERFDAPIAAYQVSGEYAMIKAAAKEGWINERAAMIESLMAIKRAGADMIITYFAKGFVE